MKDVSEALGLSEVGYGHYERGIRAFTVEQLFQLSRVLGKPVTFFLGLDTGLDPEAEDLLFHYRRIQHPIIREAARDAVRREAETDERLRAQRGDHSD